MEFSAETIARALTAIYGKEFDIDSELEAHIFEETRRIFAQAAAEGIADSVEGGADVPGDEFLKALRESVDVFSAFRTHRMQNDIAAQLTDEKGQLKPFSRFAKDVQPYVRHKNRAWLRTEYDTAIRRAHQAADWQQFEAEKDVLPNLEWIPSTSPTPGADHRVFWGTVLPVDDPFWKEHRPGDRWNCKCELRATDKDCTARPSGTEKDNPQPGLENNPGKDGHLFSDKHPYYPDSCASCQYSGNKLMALFHDLAGSKKHCNSCRKVEKVVKETKEKNLPPEHKTYKEVVKNVYMSPYHGDVESKENKNMAKVIARNIKDKVFLLPRIAPSEPNARELRDRLLPNNVYENKSPDYLIKGKLFEGKSMLNFKGNPTNAKQVKSAIENHIKSAKLQADNIVLQVPESFDKKTVRKTVLNYLNRSHKSREIWIIQGKRLRRYVKNNRL